MKKNMKEGEVTVDFNQVRERLTINYNRLVRKLNEGINNFHPIPCVELACSDIDDLMIGLRHDIATVAMTYEDNREDFKDVLLDNEIEIFNPFPEVEEE